MQTKVYNQAGQEVSTVELKDSLFAEKPNEFAVHQYVKIYLANQRQGTVAKKNRAEVSGGGAKPWRQKGTGRARSGSNTSPIWVGGGRTFGPYPRNWKTTLPKKIKKLALKSMFSFKAQEDKIKVIDDIQLDFPKTKTAFELLNKLGLAGSKCLVLDEGKNQNLNKSLRNIPGIIFKRASLVNPYDLLLCDYLVFTQKGLKEAEEIFAK
jgi:large subunit ribosomal protein L4